MAAGFSKIRLARREVEDIRPYVPGKPVEELERELGIKNAVKLASNENVLAPPRRVMAGIKRVLNSINCYPDGGCFYLRKALSKKLRIKSNQLIVGNGSDEIIVLTLRAFLNFGEEVIIAKPTFLIYEIASKIAGARIRYAPLKNFRYDVKGMLNLLTKRTKIIFIANPDNPTGTYITEKEVELLVKNVPERVILYFDEAYYEFARGIQDFPKTMKYINRGNIIITRSFSKIYSLAGLRIGYGISTGEVTDYLNRVREPFNVNLLAQAGAISALEDVTHIKRTLKLVGEGKRFLYKELSHLGLQYVPSATNFILINLKRPSIPVYKKLLKKGIIVREMSPWGLKNFIRVTIGKKKDNHLFIKALKEVL